AVFWIAVLFLELVQALQDEGEVHAIRSHLCELAGYVRDMSDGAEFVDQEHAAVECFSCRSFSAGDKCLHGRSDNEPEPGGMCFYKFEGNDQVKGEPAGREFFRRERGGRG